MLLWHFLVDIAGIVNVWYEAVQLKRSGTHIYQVNNAQDTK